MNASEFSAIQPGLLPAGTVTEHGTIVASTLTAYELADGSFVAFQQVHGKPAPATPLVRLGQA